jgi:surfeit locus 1 family protein
MMERAGELGRALVGRRWWWTTLLVVALMILLARLGVWQLDRLAQRRAANAQLMAALESPPIDLNREIAAYAAVAPGEAPPDLADRDVTARGAFDFDHGFILKLQSWQGQSGVHLITPFVLEGSDVAVLVDRGWIPDAEYAAGHTYEDGAADTVAGFIALTETIRRRTAEAVVPVSPADEIFRVDVAALAEELPYDVAPFYVKAGGPADTMRLPIPAEKEIDLSEGPHLSYAIQWFIFSLGLGIGYVIFVNRSLAPAPAGPPEAAG